MARSAAALRQNRLLVLLGGVTIVAALYFAKEVLLPIALAVLVSFLLTPLVKRLERFGLGRVSSVILVVVLSCAALGVTGYVILNQMYDLAYRLPEYKSNIIAKVETFQAGDEGLLHRLKKTLDEIRQRVSPPSESRETPAPGAAPPIAVVPPLRAPESVSTNAAPTKPLPVEIVNELTAREVAQGVLGPLVAPLGTGAIVVVFVIFMLIEREDLRNRLISLMGSRQLNTTTQAIDDAAYRVSRYLLMQLTINVIYGLVIALGLFVIGLPNALLWGFLTTVLRFVPYVGPWIAALIPMAVSLAVFDGWTRPIFVISLFALNELVSNNILEPLLYGSSTGISTMGILVSAVFWTWLWGPAGLIMATPLTVCFMVVGRYVPQFSFLQTLLSDEPVLSPAMQFYQRLLAMDPDEALEIAEDYLREHSLEALYDRVLTPALSLAEHDRHQGELEEAKQLFIHRTIRELIEDLGERSLTPEQPGEADDNAAAKRPLVVCLPARDAADEIVGMMLAQLLESAGAEAALLSVDRLTSERVEEVGTREADAVCVSALPPFASTHARYLCKRLRPKYPNLKIIAGLWHVAGNAKRAQDRLAAAGADRCATTLGAAVAQTLPLAQAARLLREPA